MKKIFIVLISLVLLLGVTGCGNKNSFDIGEKSNIEVVDKYVTFEIDDETLTNESVTVVFRNNSEYTVSYGTPYELEIKEKDEWHKINVEMFFNMPLMYLYPGESKELEFNWVNTHGELAPGEYRIIKNVTVETTSPEMIYVAAEFTIVE